MRVWKVVLLVDLALLLGLGGGYLLWGRDAGRTSEAAGRTASATGPREFHAQGVVRATLPELGVVVLTHGDIPGYMPAMTMGFRMESANIADGISVGDAVRFTLRGTPPQVSVTAIEKTGQ
jgi:Cu/Ag efflux protein CusF